MSTVICFWFGKGGCGKSLSAYAVSSYLSLQHTTLAVDLDPQSTLTNSLLDWVPAGSTYSWISKQQNLDTVVERANKNFPSDLFIAASSSKLSALDAETASNFNRYFSLSEAISNCSQKYIIIDTPPSAGVCTVSALVSADYVISPVSTDPATWEQLKGFEDLIGEVRKRMNPKLKWLGILPTKYDNRNNLDKEVLSAINRKYAGHCFSPIKNSVRLRESMSCLAPPWKFTDIFRQTTTEIIERIENGKEILS